MTRIKMRTVREFNEADLRQRIQEARGELGRLRADAAKGTLRKENGKIRATKRDIARMLTRLGEMKRQ